MRTRSSQAVLRSGLDAGADAYIITSRLDEGSWLAAVFRLIGGRA
jgi:hypothetical protein